MLGLDALDLCLNSCFMAMYVLQLDCMVYVLDMCMTMCVHGINDMDMFVLCCISYVWILNTCI